MTTPIIKISTASDEAPAIDVVVLAFSADPAARWTWPDPQQYLTHFPPFVEAFGGKAFAHGSAYYVDGYAGAALWLPPDVHPDEDALITLLQRTVSEQKLEDVLRHSNRWLVITRVSRIGICPSLVSIRSTKAKDMARR